jgi:hypothetical protein
MVDQGPRQHSFETCATLAEAAAEAAEAEAAEAEAAAELAR